MNFRPRPLALLLSTVISPMASGIVAVDLFGATWIAGVVGMVGEAFGNDGVARVPGKHGAPPTSFLRVLRWRPRSRTAPARPATAPARSRR